jgi:hypothetical protein
MVWKSKIKSPSLTIEVGLHMSVPECHFAIFSCLLYWHTKTRFLLDPQGANLLGTGSINYSLLKKMEAEQIRNPRPTVVRIGTVGTHL